MMPITWKPFLGGPSSLQFGKDVRVLIVEDEPLIALSEEETISSLHASNGDTFVASSVPSLTEARQAYPEADIVLSDGNLGAEYGLPFLLETIRPAGKPCALVSGNPDEIEKAKAANIPTLGKPFSPQTLKALVLQLAGQLPA